MDRDVLMLVICHGLGTFLKSHFSYLYFDLIILTLG